MDITGRLKAGLWAFSQNTLHPYRSKTICLSYGSILGDKMLPLTLLSSGFQGSSLTLKAMFIKKGQNCMWCNKSTTKENYFTELFQNVITQTFQSIGY